VEISMGKRKISKKAVLASLKSKKTPPALKKGLRKWAKKKGYV